MPVVTSVPILPPFAGQLEGQARATGNCAILCGASREVSSSMVCRRQKVSCSTVLRSPGTGRTMLAKAIAKKCNANFIIISIKIYLILC
jgi:hypothetical protein